MVLGDPEEQFTRVRAAVCVFLHDVLKVDAPEVLDIEDISFPRVVALSNIRSEVLIRFRTVSERVEVISHAVNLKGQDREAGVRLEIPDHLQADFKVLIQYGNEAKKHYGPDVRRSIQFFRGGVWTYPSSWSSVRPMAESDSG